MNLEYKYLLDGNFHPDSKVWIYQCNRQFSETEITVIEKMLNEFVTQWESHGDPVKGIAHLIFNQFIILMADTTDAGICGRSTDSSMRLIKDIEAHFSVNMFDRTTFAFVIKDNVQLVPMSRLQNAAEQELINGDSLYFNNLVATKKELENSWIVPLKDSWLIRKISLKDAVS